jgi:hypothetical protein
MTLSLATLNAFIYHANPCICHTDPYICHSERSEESQATLRTKGAITA